MTTENQAGYKPLYFSFLAGLCGNATLATLTMSEIQFSIFPLIALVLVVYNWYQVYMTSAIESHISKSSLGLFVIGVLIYTAFVRIEYPELGSNFLPLIVVLGLSAWVAKTLGVFSTKTQA